MANKGERQDVMSIILSDYIHFYLEDLVLGLLLQNCRYDRLEKKAALSSFRTHTHTLKAGLA